MTDSNPPGGDDMTTATAEASEKDQIAQLVTFCLEQESYGINVIQFQEVVRVTGSRPAPRAACFLPGRIN